MQVKDSSDIDRNAQIILDYMRLNMNVRPSDLIVGMGCLDTRVAERSAELYLQGYGKLIIFTGASGRITSGKFSLTEAERFRDVAIKMGVPESKILLETKSTNTGDNIRHTEALLSQKRLSPRSIIFVTKPYMERRVHATYLKQWQNQSINFTVTSPQLTYEQHYAPGTIPKDLFLNILVGDLQRMNEYAHKGYQVPQNIPSDVWAAYERLIAAGYDKQIINS